MPNVSKTDLIYSSRFIAKNETLQHVHRMCLNSEMSVLSEKLNTSYYILLRA